MILILIMILLSIVAGIMLMVSNQNAGLRKMNDMQRSLDDLNQKLRDMQTNRL
jgi:uncharacterized membrane protein (DUF106 family)